MSSLIHSTYIKCCLLTYKVIFLSQGMDLNLDCSAIVLKVLLFPSCEHADSKLITFFQIYLGYDVVNILVTTNCITML